MRDEWRTRSGARLRGRAASSSGGTRAVSPEGELWLAQAIVDVASRHARGRTVAAIELRVGRERELAPQRLDFAFALLTEGTALDGAALEIEQVSGGELAIDALRLHARR